MFSTIVSKKNGDIHHGYVLQINENHFLFALKIGLRNYTWNCNYDYWELKI